MKVGIDIDNVISNFDEEMLKEFLIHDKELRNTGIIDKNKPIARGMFDWSEEEVNDFYYSNIERIAEKLMVIDKAGEYIKKLKDNGYEIYIITGRDNGEYTNPHKMTVEWLKKHNIIYDKLIFTNANNSSSKAEVCLENDINVLIDDSARILLEADKKGITTLLMDKTHRLFHNVEAKKLRKVHNWKEIYEFITNLN